MASLIGTDPRRTLPAAAYTDPGVYQVECEQIFRREWLLVASMEQLPRTGDYLALDLVGEPIVVVRGRGGEVRALSAVCRHRYMLLAEPGRGQVGALTCPYHLWRYDLTGRLTSAPLMDDVADFDRAEHCLPSFPVEVWQGLVFVSLHSAPEPLAPRLAPISAALVRYDMSSATQVAFDDRMWGCNWKVAVENASECYHHIGTHGPVMQAILPAQNTYAAVGTPAFAVHRNPVTPGSTDWGVTTNDIDSGLLPADLDEVVIYTIFPSTLILNAGPLVLWFSFLPQGVDRCRFLNGFLAPATLTGAVDAGEIATFMTTINEQDEFIVERVQRGAASAHAEPGMLSHKEPALVDFYAYIRRALSDVDTGSDQ